MDTALIIIGGILALIGYVWLLVLAFSESVLWGVGSLFCGLVALVFGVTRFAEAKVPVLLYAAGIVLLGIGEAIKGV